MTDDRREWYIYVLRDPRDNAVRYVGFTDNIKRRFREHLKEATRGIHKSHKNNWIGVLLSLDLQPIMEVIERGTGEWQSVEQYWIRHYRMQGARLTNSTDGGEGAINPSPETREKMSKSSLGRKQSPEHIEKVRQLHLGRKRSPETIERMRQAVTRKHGIAVRRVEDGIIFASISDAARSVDAWSSGIHRAIATGGKAVGYHWERVGETLPADPYTLDGNALVMRID